MTTMPSHDDLARFVAWAGDGPLRSTKATAQHVTGDLYNVTGSTQDPYVDGLKWKPLLVDRGVVGSCYADTPLPGGASSHPGFDVGGHMTKNASGVVPDGGVTFLMPLCKWHNFRSRDGVPFAHANTWMLLLEGFMQGEPPVTFMARLPSRERWAIVYRAGGQWTHRAVTEEQATHSDRSPLTRLDPHASRDEFVLLERSRQDETQYFIREANVSRPTGRPPSEHPPRWTHDD